MIKKLAIPNNQYIYMLIVKACTYFTILFKITKNVLNRYGDSIFNCADLLLINLISRWIVIKVK